MNTSIYEPTTKKILITVKTYPTLSKTYGELVCTAGIDEDGHWRRIYPIPFRKLYNDSKYEKYRWIEADIYKNTSDPRMESYKIDYRNIKLLDSVSTENNWKERKDLVFKNGYSTDLTNLIHQSKTIQLSLATFKPTEILDFVWEEVPRQYDSKIIEKIEAEKMQQKLFKDDFDNNPNFREVNKLPYRFSYVFLDNIGKKRELMVEDWEVGAAFWQFLRSYGSEDKALEMMKDKFLRQLARERDLYFFLGTTREFHGRAKNPFIIIGLFYPPRVQQMSFTF